MSDVLIYQNRKTDPIAWDVSTSLKLDKAMLALFKILGEEWEVYQDLSEKHQKLYDDAKQGNSTAAGRLIHLRKHYEYEEFTIIHLEED